MSGNVKFRWFLLAPIVLALFVVVSSPVSWAGELEDAQDRYDLGNVYRNLGLYQDAIAFAFCIP